MLCKRAGTYIGWVGRGNLGDEVMYEICRSLFPDIHWQSRGDSGAPPGVLSAAVGKSRRRLLELALEEARRPARISGYLKRSSWRLATLCGGQLGILGGGTLINQNPGWLDAYVDVRKAVGRPIPVFGTGVAISSFWRNTDHWRDQRSQWVTLLSELPAIGVRGPHSRAELESFGLRSVSVVGDPVCFLHEPVSTAADEDESEPTVVLSYGCALGDLRGSQSRLEDLFVGFTKACKGSKLILIPVCEGDVDSCRRIASLAGLPKSAVLAPCTTATTYKAALAGAQFVLAFRLHAAIVAAALNVPFALITYRPKCDDFLASIGWERFGIDPEKATVAGLLEIMREAEQNRVSLRNELCTSMCLLRERFTRYCAILRNTLE